MRNAKQAPRQRPPATKIVATDPVTETRLTLREYIRQSVDGHTLVSLGNKSGIPYSTLHRHVSLKLPISPQTAVDLQAWSENRKNSSVTIDAARTVIDGVKPRSEK